MVTKYHNETLLKVGHTEDIFVIRAQDAFAVHVIEYWIELATKEGVNDEKINSAKEYLADIVNWQKYNKTKLPD